MRLRLALIAVFIMVCSAAVFSRTVAGDKTAELHPLVGAWTVTIDIGMDGSPQALFMFHSDHTVLATDTDGRTWYGAWVETGALSAKYTLVKSGASDQTASFSGTAEVDPAGTSWSRSANVTMGAKIEGLRINAE